MSMVEFFWGAPPGTATKAKPAARMIIDGSSSSNGGGGGCGRGGSGVISSSCRVASVEKGGRGGLVDGGVSTGGDDGDASEEGSGSGCGFVSSGENGGGRFVGGVSSSTERSRDAGCVDDAESSMSSSVDDSTGGSSDEEAASSGGRRRGRGDLSPEPTRRHGYVYGMCPKCRAILGTMLHGLLEEGPEGGWEWECF